MIRAVCILTGAMLIAASVAGCGDEGPASPSIRVKDKGCNFDCNDPEMYYLYFTSSIRGNYAVSVHGSDGSRWSIIQAGEAQQRQEIKVQIDADEVPTSGGFIRITVVTGDGGTGRSDCALSPDWANARCG